MKLFLDSRDAGHLRYASAAKDAGGDLFDDDSRRYIAKPYHMILKNTFTFFILLIATTAWGQKIDYEDAFQKAIAHRQTQNAAHVILWNRAIFQVNIDSFFVDQSIGLLTIHSGKYLVKYNIKILGTYDHKDSTFLWSTYNPSVHKRLTSPVDKLMSVAAANHWPIANTTKIKCPFDSAYNLATLAFYLDSANGMIHVMTNHQRTNVIFSFYDVRVYDRSTNTLIANIPTKKQYKLVEDPALIALCKKYITEYDASETKYYRLYSEHNKDNKYLDTMFFNRIKISDKYWDTTSVDYHFFRKNRLQALNHLNWRVIEIRNSRYVLYDEKQNWLPLKTWAFKMCEVAGQTKICNEYVCF
jgi:hypothetical protein